MNRLLQRQVARHYGPPTTIPAAWQPLLAAVGAAYEHDDARRRLLERAFTLASEELLARIQALQDEVGRLQRSEHALRQSEAGFRQLFSANPLPMWTYDLDTLRMLTVNEAAVQRYGYSHAEFLAMRILDLSAPNDPARLLADRDTPRTALPSAGEGRHRRKDGSIIDVQITADILEMGEQRTVLVVAEDITERKAFEEQLHYHAFHDALTGLPNRALLLDRLDHALARDDRRSHALAVLFLDLDRFKVVNDSLGHEAGDRLLLTVAQRLGGCLRREDTLARFGGDEFAILLEDVADIHEATAVAERILESMQVPVTLSKREVFITASIGVVYSRPGEKRATDLLRDVDIALYRAKSKGKSRFEIFDASMNAQAMARLELESRLRRALERGEFEVHYQPLIALASGHVTGMEALVRWRHPERGLVAPGEFIPLAEETGLIRPLGQWVLEQACRQTQQWQARFPGARDLRMSINLSAREFQQPDLVPGITHVLHLTGVDPRCVQFEITESVVLEDAEANSATLRKLRALGVQLAIDDFGTGYSSLSYLKRLPVDTLKIDRTFVTGLGTDPENAAIVAAVIGLAHALRMDVVAEGVESADDWRHLRTLGCAFGQGAYFAAPLSAAAASEILAAGLPSTGELRSAG